MQLKSAARRPLPPAAVLTVLAVGAAGLFPLAANAQNVSRGDRDERPVVEQSDGFSRRDFLNLSGRLSARTQRARAGDTVALFYTITNDSRVTQTFRFPSSLMFDMEASRVDVRADDRRGNGQRRADRWRYSDEQFGAQVMSEFTLRPGQSRSFAGTWRIDRNLSPGTYEVTSFLTPQRSNRVAPAVTRILVESGGYNGGYNGGRDGQEGRGDYPKDGGGWGVGYNGGNRDNSADRGEILTVDDLTGASVRRYADRRITVRGIYRGYDGNGNNNSSGDRNRGWLLGGLSARPLIILGLAPRNTRVNDRITVSGTLRQSRDGRLTLQAD